MIWFARRERSHVQRRVVPPAVVLRGHEDNDWVLREEGARTRLVADGDRVEVPDPPIHSRTASGRVLPTPASAWRRMMGLPMTPPCIRRSL